MTDHSGERRFSASTSEPTRLQLLDRAVRRLTAADRSAPRRTAEWLLTEVLGCNRAELYAESDRPVPPDDANRFEAMIDRRVDGEPLQHILGYTSFFGLRIDVTPDVMVPRPETELVVERALACIDDIDAPRVLDVGTGSGCLALAIKHERSDAVVHACDVSSEALAVARRNASSLSLDVTFSLADVTTETIPDDIPRGLDLLVSNPPYIPDAEADRLPTVVREYDPDIALFAGEEPVRIYRSLARWVRELCMPGGQFVFEIHAAYGDEVQAALAEEALRDIVVEADLNDRPRMVWGRSQDPSRV